jgi:hypothetical protein
MAFFFGVRFQTSPAVLIEKIVVGLGLVKGLAKQRSRKKIAKRTHTGCGQETKWEIPVQILTDESAKPRQPRLASSPLLLGDFGKRQQTL